MKAKNYKITHLGSVEDVRCSLRFLEESITTPEKAVESMKWLNEALQEEEENKNRVSVKKMIAALFRRILKVKLRLEGSA